MPQGRTRKKSDKSNGKVPGSRRAVKLLREEGELARGPGDEGDLRKLSEMTDELAALAEVEEDQLRVPREAETGGRAPTCAKCSRPISPKRLRAMPGTKFCRDCQEQIEAETSEFSFRRAPRVPRMPYGSFSG